MPEIFRYQAVILDPSRSGGGAELSETFLQRCNELGLSADDVVVLNEDDYPGRRNLKAPIAGVYFGPGETGVCTAVAEELVKVAAPVLPLVPSFEGYKQQVPCCLHGLNAMPIEAADGRRERAAAWLLEELGLLRKQRLALVHPGLAWVGRAGSMQRPPR